MRTYQQEVYYQVQKVWYQVQKGCGIKSKRGVVSSPKNRVENLNKPFKYNAKIRTTNQLILTSYTNLLYLT